MQLKKTAQPSVRSVYMTNIKPESHGALVKKLFLALPFLALLAAFLPSAQADEHHGFYHRHGYYRHHYHHRGYYYRHHHRYYYGDNRYYAPRPGVSVNVGL